MMKAIAPPTAEPSAPRRTLPDEATMYRALVERDSTYEGLFVVAVKTTSIFCRPTCPAKKPHARNVEFFAAPADALAAGYRPCRRCRPLDLHRSPPKWVAQLTKRIDEDPAGRLTDAELRAMKIEPERARSYFKRHYGMTFHAYHRARRLGLALAELRDGRDTLAVGERIGYESASGFRDAFAKLFGNPPGRARDTTTVLEANWLDTPLGPMLAIAHRDEGLALLEFVDRRGIEKQIERMRRRFDNATVVPGMNNHLNRTADELARYFDGRLARFRTKLALRGSEFQLSVWRELQNISSGATTTYSNIARSIDRADAHRAVARANGDNRIAIIIPCHRVIGSNGSLCGYGGHLWRKQWLLDHERKQA